MRLHIYSDGACWGNPGPSAIGAIVKSSKEAVDGEYLVIVDFDGPSKTITLNRAPRIAVTNTDTFTIYHSDITVPTSLVQLASSYPEFCTIDNRNSQIISGIKITGTNQTPWVGDIPERYYFGREFKYSGIYATSMAEDFTRGAFRKTYQHINTKVALSPQGAILSTPIGDMLYGVFDTVTWKDEINGDATPVKLDGNIATYLTPKTPTSAHGTAITFSMSGISVGSLSVGYTGTLSIYGWYATGAQDSIKFRVQVGLWNTNNLGFTSIKEEYGEFKQVTGTLGLWTCTLDSSLLKIPVTDMNILQLEL